MSKQVTFNGGTPTKVVIFQEDMYLTKDINVICKVGKRGEPIIRINNNNTAYRLVNRAAFAPYVQDAIKRAIPNFDKLPMWGKAQDESAATRGQKWTSAQVNESKANYINLKS